MSLRGRAQHGRHCLAEQFGPVSVEVSDGVATVTVDKPPVNAMGREVLAGLGGAAERVGPAPEVRAVVLTGTGQAAFMAGADAALPRVAVTCAKRAVNGGRARGGARPGARDLLRGVLLRGLEQLNAFELKTSGS